MRHQAAKVSEMKQRLDIYGKQVTITIRATENNVRLGYSGTEGREINQNLTVKYGSVVSGRLQVLEMRGVEYDGHSEHLVLTDAQVDGQALGSCRIPLVNIHSINGIRFFNEAWS